MCKHVTSGIKEIEVSLALFWKSKKAPWFFEKKNLIVSIYGLHFSLNRFSSSVTFLYPWKLQKTKVFLTFSGGIEMWHWTKIGQSAVLRVSKKKTQKCFLEELPFVCCRWNNNQNALMSSKMPCPGKFQKILKKKKESPLREKCPYSELFWSVFSPNAGKYGPE